MVRGQRLAELELLLVRARREVRQRIGRGRRARDRGRSAGREIVDDRGDADARAVEADRARLAEVARVVRATRVTGGVLPARRERVEAGERRVARAERGRDLRAPLRPHLRDRRTGGRAAIGRRRAREHERRDDRAGDRDAARDQLGRVALRRRLDRRDEARDDRRKRAAGSTASPRRTWRSSHAGTGRGAGADLARGHRRPQRGRGRAGERMLAVQRLVQRDRERVLIAARIRRLARDQLGREYAGVPASAPVSVSATEPRVGRRATGRAPSSPRAREPEVGDARARPGRRVADRARCPA